MLLRDPYSELTIVPYVKGVAEHASSVRTLLKEREGSDFILAIDLPHGLEDQVLRAVKRLPRISLIVDRLWRAIPVIPTCGSIEAVRTFLETGLDLTFIDTSLPICGKFEEWRRFSEYCREFGQKEVIARAGEYGINLNELLFGKETKTQRSRPNFMHISRDSGKYLIPQFSTFDSPYMEARQRFMAMRLQALREEKSMDVVVVCDVRNISAIQHYLKEPSPEFDDSFIFDTVTCRVKEKDIIKISPEIPLFMHHYEIFRDQEWSREHWLQELLACIEPVPEGLSVRDIYRYSRNLALTDGQLYPGLYNLLAAAKYCAGDSFALRLLERASSYPGADQDSNCEVRFYCDYNLSPVGDARVLELKDNLVSTPDWQRDDKKHGAHWKRHHPPLGTIHFKRTTDSLQHEKNFMLYMKQRFQYLQPTDEFTVEEFSCGLKDGIDERETLRHTFQDKIYVKERRFENTAAYVMDFGEIPTWRVYFDTIYHMVGAARRQEGNSHTWVCFAAFLSPPKPMEELIDEVDLKNPRDSCLDMALEYADHVFLFTDTIKRPFPVEGISPGVRIIDLQTLPWSLRETMRWFHVAS
jgi:hypothetical protein